VESLSAVSTTILGSNHSTKRSGTSPIEVFVHLYHTDCSGTLWPILRNNATDLAGP
jgi:hypothetical protein